VMLGQLLLDRGHHFEVVAIGGGADQGSGSRGDARR
jgi:hypothetical protein